MSLSGPGPPQFSHFQGSDSSLKTKYDPPMASQTLTLQPGHQVKALPQGQDSTLGICSPMGSGTPHSFLDPYPLVGSCHTSTELSLPQSSLVPTPPPLSRDPCPKSDPSVRVRISNPAIGIPYSRSRNSHPRSEDPRPLRTRSWSGLMARALTHLALADMQQRTRPGGRALATRPGDRALADAPWRTHPGGAGSAAGSPAAEAPQLWRRPQ